jgi:glycosyltransferase involved in cell wall biosynthesis
MRILAIIPAYNEEGNIKSVIESLQTNTSGIDYVVINDCSNDRTIEILADLNANYISLPANLGIGGGVQTGYLYALRENYDVAIQVDGDGQHDPRYIEELIAPILESRADIVIGSRFIRKDGFQSSAVRRFGIKFLSFLIKVCCKVSIMDVTSGFRAVNRNMIGVFAHDYAQDYPEPEAIISAAMHNARIIEVPVVMSERLNGKSSISSFRSVYYMIKVSISIVLYRLSFTRKRN